MNPIAQYNLTRHELIGMQVSVILSSHNGYVGIKGKVLDETKNTLIITNGVKRRRIPKAHNVFCFTLPDNSLFEIDGPMILGRPVERIKNR